MKIYSKNRSFIFWKWVNWIGPFFIGLWLKEYFLSNIIRMELFANMTHRIELFEYDSKIFFWKKKKPHRIQPLFFEYDQRIGFFLEYDAKMTHRIEPFFQICLGLNFFFSKNWTPYFWLDSKYWTFHFNYGSKNWTFLNMTQRIVFFINKRLKEFSEKKKRLKELNSFSK